MKMKKWYKIYGSVHGIEYHLATVNSPGNAHIVALVFLGSYTDVNIDGKRLEILIDENGNLDI